MKKQEFQKLIKVEERVKQIVDDMGLKVYDIEFDICQPQKMLEIMAYRIPTNISSWKYGRNYERLRTIYEKYSSNLPYEVVINSDPARAFLMNNNTFAVHALVIAHVFGHVNVFAENKYFTNSRQDIMGVMAQANKRFNEYERKYGIDEVEQIVDAGHAIQLHSSPFDKETEEEKRERIYNHVKQKIISSHQSKEEYSDLIPNDIKDFNHDLELVLQKIKRNLRLKSPVEPTTDLLRYIIDNSRILEDWQKDILEMLRMEGRYFWPMMKTHYLNEGWATFVHEKVMRKLFQEDVLNISDHAQYTYSNALVKAENPESMNPYLIGSKMWEDIESRWNTGQHGKDWDLCSDEKERENWDTEEMAGWEKCKGVMRTYTDWAFFQNFLTTKLVDDLNMYIYQKQETPTTIDYVIIKKKAEEIKTMIINSFAHSSIPLIEAVDGNINGNGSLLLEHRWDHMDLEGRYAKETCKHICRLWGNKVYLRTREDKSEIQFVVEPKLIM
jgi:stage V sporulation protein R